MNLLLSYIAGHLLSIIEQELVNNEPEIVELTVKEIQLLIGKLESYISSKSSSVAAVANPVLNEVSTLATTGVSAAGYAIASSAAS